LCTPRYGATGNDYAVSTTHTVQWSKKVEVDWHKYFWSLIAGGVLTALAAAISSIGFSIAGYLLLPGIFAAALVLPEGIHSDWAGTYLVLAVLANVFLLSWPVFGFWIRIERLRRR
jgi:hypothetical protein